MNQQSTRSPEIPFWKIWVNPIVRRYTRSRMRPGPLGIWTLLTLLISGFLFFSLRSVGHHHMGMESIDAARMPIISLLVMQGIILFIMGAGQAAGGMVAEKDEGVIDYQRLAPMKPLSKVIGYLFGLPIREWLLFFLTLPFSLISMIQGEVPLTVIGEVYLVILVAAMVYHMTGLVAGTLMKNGRAAYLSLIGLVFVLYTVLPQISKVGLPYFKYLTIYPVLEENSGFFVSRNIGALKDTVENLLPTARFFNLDLPQAAFTLLSFSVLLLTMGMMLWRRWRRVESHLLGKPAALGFYAWVQLALVGNAIPLIESGAIFPSNSIGGIFSRAVRNFKTSIDPEEALIMVGMYGITSAILIWLLTLVITPKTEGLIRGWRRARKRGQSRLSIISDPATATPWVAAMALMGTIGWVYFARSLMHSRHFPEYELTLWTVPAFACVLFLSALLFQTILESKGFRFLGILIIIVGIIPVMSGAILLSISEDFLTAASWLFGICPLFWPLYASAVSFPSGTLDLELARVIPNTFVFWQGTGLLIAGWCLIKLREYRNQIDKAVISSSNH